MLRLLGHARGERRAVAWAATASVVNKVLDLAPPALIGVAVDAVVHKEDSVLARFGIVEVRAQLVALTWLTIIIFVLESLFEYAYGVAWRGLAQRIQHALRVQAYDHVQRLDLAWFEDRSTGGLLTILNDDVNQLERFLDGGANDLLQVSTTVVVIGGAFVWAAPDVAWVALLPMPFIVAASLWFQRRMAPRYAAVREQAGHLGATLAGNVQGVATIKGFTAEAHEVERVRAASQAYLERNRTAIALSAAFSPLIRMVIVVAVVATLFLGGLATLEGRLTVGTYSLLVFLIQRLLWPLTRLGATVDLYQRALASTTRILDLLDARPKVESGATPLPRAGVKGEVTFEAVRFEYVPGHPVIDGISLVCPAGQTTAVVGATGAGKSTIVKLLLRFYEPTGGRVTLDGHDLRALRTDDLRRAVGVVSQDTFLFHGTARENVAYGSWDAPFERIVEAARAAEALHFVERLPLGWDTVVGERGQKLSGGQRQRLAIARAVLKDPPVLVLDEATSSVDNETEAAIQRSLERLAVGRTTIIIAHRLSTVRNAHRIHVLDAGRIAESGTHEELLGRDGLYAALWRVQTGERAGAGRATVRT